jgi:hypothetical protein
MLLILLKTIGLVLLSLLSLDLGWMRYFEFKRVADDCLEHVKNGVALANLSSPQYNTVLPSIQTQHSFNQFFTTNTLNY